jgi:hypothetical protein
MLTYRLAEDGRLVAPCGVAVVYHGLLLAALGVGADEFGRHLGPWGGTEPKVTLTVHR